MRFLRILTIIGLSVAIANATLFAQKTSSSRSGSLVRGKAQKTAPATTSSSMSSTSVKPTRSYGSTLFDRGSGISTGTSSLTYDPYVNRCVNVVNSYWTYNPYYRDYYDRSFRNNCYGFFGLLGRQYRFNALNFDRALERFSYGDAALTSDILNLALQDSTLAVDTMLADIQSLRAIVASYQAGEIDRESFERQVKIKLDLIRDSARSVRKDYYVNFVDNSEVALSDGDFERAGDLAELQAMIDRLEAYALKMQSRLDSLGSSDRDVRRVTVDELRQTSIQSLSKGIDDLAKTIRKSSQSL